MKLLAFGLLFVSSIASAPGFLLSTIRQPASIPVADPDFSIVLFPDTQYYTGQNSYVFRDQANWVVANQAALNIKMVVGLGDIVDSGGYPVDKSGNMSGSCAAAPSPTWQTQWQQAQAAINILTSHGIYYQPTIGNHDYDCQADRPQPRGTTNYFHYFSPPVVNPTAYILDSSGNRTPNFYKIMKIGSTNYMILSLELFPQNSSLAAANNLISNFSGPVIVVTHAYLSNDGSGPTFGSTHQGRIGVSAMLWFSEHDLRLSARFVRLLQPRRSRSRWNRSLVQVGRSSSEYFHGSERACAQPQPWKLPHNSGLQRSGVCELQRTIVDDTLFQSQPAHSDTFGFSRTGKQRLLRVRLSSDSHGEPSRKTVSVFTYSPSIANSPGNFPAGIPAYKNDSYNQFTVNFPNTFGGPDTEITHITAPLDGSHVPLTFGISAAAHGADSAARMQIYVDGVKYADYPTVSSLPSGTAITLPSPGLHRVAVQTYDRTKSTWVKSAIYVRNP